MRAYWLSIYLLTYYSECHFLVKGQNLSWHGVGLGATGNRLDQQLEKADLNPCCLFVNPKPYKDSTPKPDKARIRKLPETPGRHDGSCSSRPALHRVPIAGRC